MALISFGPHFDPFAGLAELQRELDRYLGNPGGFDFGVSGRGVFPPVNVFGDEDGIVVRAEVPGIKPESIALSIERRTLRMSGERAPAAVSNGSFHRRERASGKFARSLQLPADLDTEKATADCRNGVLTIRIPRAAASRPRTIKVTS